MRMDREKAAWTLVAGLGTSLLAVVTIMLTFIASTQNDLVDYDREMHDRVVRLEARECGPESDEDLPK